MQALSTSFRNKPVQWALAASLVIHIIAFLLTSWAAAAGWILAATQRVTSVPSVIELTLDEDRPREVVEAPESARREQPAEEAKLASDKNAEAQNPEAPENLPLGEAYSQGLLQSQRPASPPRPTAPPAKPAGGNAAEAYAAIPSEQPFYFGAASFRREMLTGKHTPHAPAAESEVSPGHDQQATRAQALGDFSLNTYEWEFAPYLLWLRRRIYENIFPPPAFTHMGLISGETQLRFRIYPDGTLQTLEVLNFNGHESLMNTSVRAVQLSAPFRKLPENFPEAYLEITAHFEYTVIRP